MELIDIPVKPKAAPEPATGPSGTDALSPKCNVINVITINAIRLFIHFECLECERQSVMVTMRC